MTATLPARPTTTPTNGNGSRRPVRIEIEQHELVGLCMDGDTLASEAAYANGATLQLLLTLPRDAAIEQAIVATHEAHEKLMALIRRMRTAAGHYDQRPNGA